MVLGMVWGLVRIALQTECLVEPKVFAVPMVWKKERSAF
ncbi:hypothetical protein MPNT_220007 [Candidatus Methylacidithermus pantelleriae]|uniref:Uncharacterized protein n=1 Tax=Candidatus Methylacidithermus pantelleriae TaxID=2744239 RepID=A0A8J2FNQ6_9BACT|nr:hypothetical protein MPNT_220007 [Candidatus Methylacidithermus pantelleriae]